jgi:WD40 repeat protein
MEIFLFTIIQVNKITLILNIDDTWHVALIKAHSYGVTSISAKGFSNNNSSQDSFKDLTGLNFVSAGNDNLIKVWTATNNDINNFTLESVLEGHEEAIREIAWRPKNDSDYDVIASGGDVIYYYNNFISIYRINMFIYG